MSVDLCLQLPRRQSATTFFLSIFSLTPWLVSLGFISICPHFASSCGSGVKAEMQTWKEDVCVSLCVFVCVRRREKELRGERKRKSEAVAKVEGGSLGFFPCHRKSVWPVTKCQANEDGSGGRA